MKIRAFLLSLVLALVATAAPSEHWVVTWGTSPAPQLATEEDMRQAKLIFENQTLRELIHTSIAGGTVRVRFSNAYGKQTLEIGGAHIAVQSSGSNIVAGSDRALTFDGRTTVAIPPDAPALSDPVKLNVPAASNIAISIFIPRATRGAGVHYGDADVLCGHGRRHCGRFENHVVGVSDRRGSNGA